MNSVIFGKSTLLKYRLLNSSLFFFLSVAAATFFSLPASVAQEKQEQQDVSKEGVEKYKEIKKAAKKEKVEKAVQEDQTGTDLGKRAFAVYTRHSFSGRRFRPLHVHERN